MFNYTRSIPPPGIYGSNPPPVGATTLHAPLWRPKLPPICWRTLLHQFGARNSRRFGAVACLLVFRRRNRRLGFGFPPVSFAAWAQLLAPLTMRVGGFICWVAWAASKRTAAHWRRGSAWYKWNGLSSSRRDASFALYANCGPLSCRPAAFPWVPLAPGV